MPVRIYDISKKLGLANKEIISKARALGIAAAKVASSSLDKITAEYLEEQILKDHPELTAPKPPPEPPKPAPPEPILIVSAPPPLPAVQAAKHRNDTMPRAIDLFIDENRYLTGPSVSIQTITYQCIGT